MRIIAIDPGTHKSARLIWVDGEVGTPAIEDNATVREWIVALSNFQPMDTVLAVEMIACYGMPVGAETFETCLFIGRLQEIWKSKGLPFRLVYRRDVKLHLCGSARAKDGNVRQALIDRYGKPGTKKSPGPTYGVSSHLWSALAVAVTAEHQIVTEANTA